MHQANERFAQAFEHAPVGMAIADLEGRLLQVNQSLCKLLGYEERRYWSSRPPTSHIRTIRASGSGSSSWHQRAS